MKHELRKLENIREKWGVAWTTRKLNEKEMDEFRKDCMNTGLKMLDIMNYLKITRKKE